MIIIMEGQMKVKFPCGYEYEEYIKSGFLDIAIADFKMKDTLCPIHGKNCRKEKSNGRY
jgi:hypothetical protein